MRITDSLRSGFHGMLLSAAVAMCVCAVSVHVSAQQAPSFPNLGADVPVGEGRTQPCLDQVAGDALCGRFRVYENRTTHVGRTLDLAFVVLKALNNHGNRDAFTQFNGGPGGPMTPLAFSMASYTRDIRMDRDVLLLDFRGTGNSGALACTNPFPGGIASRFETIIPLDHIDDCREMLSRRANLSQYTTANSMDDLADLASWLGYTQLNLYGKSYGTREAQIFTRRHPDMVRTVILNGVGAVDRPMYLYHARGLQDALDSTVHACEIQPACKAAYPDLESVVHDVLDTATRRPPSVMVEGTKVRFGIGPLSYALRGLLYDQSGSVPARLYEAHRGDWHFFKDYYLTRQAWVGAAQGVPAGDHLSVICAEDIDPLSWDDISRETSGTFMGDFLISSYKQACDHWHSAKLPASYFLPVRSNKPVLLLSGGQDPVTPVVGAEEVAKGWPNSVQVVVPNGGHGQGGPCIDAMIQHLLSTGSVEGIDASCVSSSPPTRFEMPGEKQ
jgi:pimeloyl-ACP methyl ester carboxylesterase